MKIEQKEFGRTKAGEVASLYTLTNGHGSQVQISDYGATIVSIFVPDRTGKLANVNAGFPDLDGYLQRHPYFGSTVGRFANRIRHGRFSIDGVEFRLATNHDGQHLHGGWRGFDQLLWQPIEPFVGEVAELHLGLLSPDGQEGYPGNLNVRARFRWDDEHRLTVRYQATSDRPTHVNLTNHAYFNLDGIGDRTILDHRLQLSADHYLAVGDGLTPTGEVIPVAGTILDFTQPRRLGDHIEELPETLGYDHCFILRGLAGALRDCGTVFAPASGRRMTVRTTQPAVQLYTANHLDGGPVGGNLPRFAAFCLETQHYPDSPNQPQFPTTLLKPGEMLDETTTFQFSIEK